jgi:hypothetical protein
MESRTKRTVSESAVALLVATAFGDGVGVAGLVPLTEGMFSTAFRVRLTGGREVVLKVAPPPDAALLTYERGIMRTEVLFYRLARERTTAPLPDLLYAGHTGRTPGAGEDVDFLFLSMLSGTPVSAVRPRLSGPRHSMLRRELGGIVAGLHTLTGSGFGYPQDAGLLAADWPSAFTLMVEAVLADAVRFGVTVPADRVRAAVLACRGALAEVTTPVLTHFDIWDANVFVELGAGSVRVEGLIDPERAFWGDPYADFAVIGLSRDVQDDLDFLAGYREAGGVAEFTPAVRLRLACYRIYLFLIMIVEGTPRGYTGAAHERRAAEWRRRLHADLAAVETG